MFIKMQIRIDWNNASYKKSKCLKFCLVYRKNGNEPFGAKRVDSCW